MTQQNELNIQSFSLRSLIRPALIGAGIALGAISFFVFGVDNPNPEWGSYWQLRPLIITPLAGAAGGAFYAVMKHWSKRGLNYTLAVFLSLVIFILSLFLGIVLGLDGTMWD